MSNRYLISTDGEFWYVRLVTEIVEIITYTGEHERQYRCAHTPYADHRFDTPEAAVDFLKKTIEHEQEMPQPRGTK
jgi:hypothetical protein